ncbi:MAG: DUF427 domain-containing protein [Gammaproteobacteria bacterium]
MWRYHGQERPPWADTPGPGQESVWDYPRPPRLERWARLVEVHAGPQCLARSRAAWRVCETASPPTVYLPPDDVELGLLVAAPGRSMCEWKGTACYLALVGAPETPVAWTYRSPAPAFTALRDHVAFYPARLDCRVDGAPVRAQPGGFYGGWITAELAGPFKGAPGSGHW